MNSKVSKMDRTDDPRFIETVRDSAEQIWQAGLGAFAKAQKEGEELFARLVKDGVDVQKQVQQMAGERVSGLTDTVSKMAGNLGVQASDSWEKLENAFEDRVSRALHGLGVPTRSDIKALGTQIGELRKSVDALAAKKAPAKAAAKKPAAKAAKKTTSAKTTKARTSTAKVAPRVAARRSSVSSARA